MFKQLRKSETHTDFNITGLSIFGLKAVLVDILEYQEVQDIDNPSKVLSGLEISMEMGNVSGYRDITEDVKRGDYERGPDTLLFVKTR